MAVTFATDPPSRPSNGPNSSIKACTAGMLSGPMFSVMESTSHSLMTSRGLSLPSFPTSVHSWASATSLLRMERRRRRLFLAASFPALSSLAPIFFFASSSAFASAAACTFAFSSSSLAFKRFHLASFAAFLSAFSFSSAFFTRGSLVLARSTRVMMRVLSFFFRFFTPLRFSLTIHRFSSRLSAASGSCSWFERVKSRQDSNFSQ
mmetsp:Transcript_83732/g.167702  ORF Transcript_83732/g.167702 Transcript_83732/m.167702 type:complete len:206 (-) Transcript_83732:620-1237(-)